jgi:phytoene synthase
MDLYDTVAYQHAKDLTLAYSSSFGLSSRLFAAPIRKHIYAIYGLVRIADEIVDTYAAAGAREVLDTLEQETYAAIKRQYSANPIVHAFAKTAHTYGITKQLIKPFFESMRMDLLPKTYTDARYQVYIYGSAEVVGLMCLKVFCGGDEVFYDALAPGAQRLGAAYQKVNFLRDVRADYDLLGRTYFPGVAYDQFSDDEKAQIVSDIEADFDAAREVIHKLPPASRRAVATSYAYYHTLLDKLRETPIAAIKQERVRVSGAHKLWLMATTLLKGGMV